MSGGKRIDDHASFAGSPQKGMPLPMGNKVKEMSDASDDGHEVYYEDTASAIEKAQDQAARVAKAHKMKDGYRN